MSLSSKKSEHSYNRGDDKLAFNEAMAEEFAYSYPDDYEEPCRESCCHTPIGELHRNRIVLVLFKLRVINEEILHNNLY